MPIESLAPHYQHYEIFDILGVFDQFCVINDGKLVINLNVQ